MPYYLNVNLWKKFMKGSILPSQRSILELTMIVIMALVLPMFKDLMK